MSKPKTPEQREKRRQRRLARRIAKKEGRQFSATHCNRCGKLLTDPDSVKHGFGPTCWAKLTHGQDSMKGMFPQAEEAVKAADEERAKCLCGYDLRNEPVQGYDHDSGWNTLLGKKWLFVTCPVCGYDMALWKMGIGRENDFSQPMNGFGEVASDTEGRAV